MIRFGSRSARVTGRSANAAAGAVLLLLPLVLFGCDRLQNTGEESIEITAEVQAGYEQFQRTGEPYFFAVSVDGDTYGYTACSSIGKCVRTGARVKAIEACEQVSSGVPCRIYANASRIVWEGPAAAQPGALSKTAPPIPEEGPSDSVTLIQCRLPDGFRLAMVAARCRAVGGQVE